MGFAIQLGSYICGVTFAFFMGAYILGDWKPRLRRPAPLPRAPLPDPAPWEEDSFYREPVLAVVTDARPARRWFRHSNGQHFADLEADTFIGELHDDTDDQQAWGYEEPQPTGPITITSVEDIQAWGDAMNAWIASWGTEEEVKQPALASGR